MTDYALIVTDTSPLITLSKADELNLLLKLSVPVEVPDVVFFEATAEGYEDGQRLREWINDHKDQVRIVPTQRSIEWQVLKDNGQRPRGYGELAAAEAIDSFVRHNPGKTPIILYEDADVEKLRGLPNETELITTGTLLRALEEARMIQSADQVLDQALAAGRNVDRQRDQGGSDSLASAFERLKQRHEGLEPDDDLTRGRGR